MSSGGGKKCRDAQAFAHLPTPDIRRLNTSFVELLLEPQAARDRLE